MDSNKEKLQKYREEIPRDIVFGVKWFEKHQAKLLWLLNTPVIKIWFRWVMRIRKYDCPLGEEIAEIRPSNFTFKEKLIWIPGKKGLQRQRTTDFRTHDKYSKRLYFAFKPFWYLLHFFDWAMLDRVDAMAKLSFGFATLTAYPAAGENSPVDGLISARNAVSSGWAATRGASAGYFTDSTGGQAKIMTGIFSDAPDKYYIQRYFCLFDTAALTSGASISDAVLSVAGNGSANQNGDNDGDDYIAVITTTPASNTTLVDDDFDQVGFVEQSTQIDIGVFVSTAGSYNNFTFNSTGRGNVSKTSISKFGLLEGHDILNRAYAGAAETQNAVTIRTADYTGTSSDPKLVITYTISTAYTKTINETLSLVDTVLKRPTRNLLETLNLTDTFSFLKIQSLVLSEIVSLTDTLVKFTTRVFSETVTLTDSYVRALTTSRVYTETVALTDSLLSVITRIFTETISFSDTLTSLTIFTRNLTETITHTDTYISIKSAFRTLSETITLTDATITKAITRVFTETLSLTGTLVKAITAQLRRVGIIRGKNTDTGIGQGTSNT